MVITMQLLLCNQWDLIVQLEETTKGEKKLEDRGTFGGRVRTAKSAFKSAFLGTLKSAFTRKSAF